LLLLKLLMFTSNSDTGLTNSNILVQKYSLPNPDSKWISVYHECAVIINFRKVAFSVYMQRQPNTTWNWKYFEKHNNLVLTLAGVAASAIGPKGSWIMLAVRGGLRSVPFQRPAIKHSELLQSFTGTRARPSSLPILFANLTRSVGPSGNYRNNIL
jgi:hypothetical protein